MLKTKLKTLNIVFSFFLFLIISQSGLLFAAKSEQAPLQAGRDYRLLSSAQQIQNKIHSGVSLFIWYGCETCLRLERQLKKQYPQSENWQRLPANLAPSWRISSKTFFVLRQLQEPFAMDLQLMEATHDLGSSFTNLESLVSFLSNLGLNQKQFLTRYHSQKINQQLKEQKQFEQSIGLTKIPAALINGKYLIDITMVQTLEQFIERIKYLQQLDASSKDGQ